mmetsp:Transcript_19100/g.38452  ORF Transcript_19100/g.38452 Transcript_19100/m.38452 type:complete len:590 (+) Transcript_19100:38-1807(+)
MAATSPDQEDKRERRRSRKDGGESSRKKMKRKRKRSHHRHKRRRRERSPSEEDDGYSSSASNHSSSSASPSSSSRSSSISSRRRGRHRSRRGDDRKHSRRHQENNTSLTSSRHRSRSPSPDNRRKNTRDNHHPHRSPPPMRKRRSDSRDHHDKRRRHRHKSSDGRSSNYDDDKSQQRHKRKRKHRSSSSGSSKDDTTGHFKGGRGTLVGDHYRILRDVGLGTFGRVVQCEYVNKDDRHSNRVSDSRSSSKHRSSSRDRRDGNGKHGNGKKQSQSQSNNSSKNNNNTVAIKIVRNVRRYYESALIEGDICERVNREQSRQNKDFCARMIDRFSLHSTGHYCLVFECLGMSLYDFLKRHSYRPFPMYCVQDFARQMLEAVDFLHGFHLIHTDLKPENILLSNNDVTTTHRLWDGKTQRVPVSTKVKMIDFGGATYNDEKKSSIINTRQYRAPEVILGWGWSYPSDLWSVGCIIAELYRGELLFATHDNAEHLALMERAVGPFPRECLDKSTNSLTRECFDTRGWHKIGAVLSPRSIEHVRKMAPVEMLVDERDRRSGLGQLLRSLLMIDPKRRATAREALMSPFFANRIGC